MKTKKQKKSLRQVRVLVPGGEINPEQDRKIIGGANPWLDEP